MQYLEEPDALEVELDEQEALVGQEHLLQVLRHLAQARDLDATLDDTRALGVVTHVQRRRDDGCTGKTHARALVT